MVRADVHHPGRWLYAIALALGVAGCSDVDTLRTAAPAQGGFPGALAREYLSYAESEYEQGRWSSSQRLAAKGLEASHGEAPVPEEPQRAQMHDDDWRMLTDARQRLGDRLGGKIPEDMQDETARAQLLYECWLSQVESQRLPAAEAPCGGEFEAAMSQIEHDNPSMRRSRRMASTVIAFAAGQAQLDNAAEQKLSRIARKSNKLGEYRIYVTGYADAAGREDANRALARERAGQARDLLVALGVPQEHIIVRSGGVLAPVEFEDGTAPAPVRRVEAVLYRLGRP